MFEVETACYKEVAVNDDIGVLFSVAMLLQRVETLFTTGGNAPEALMNACLAEYHDANITCRRMRVVLGAKTAT